MCLSDLGEQLSWNMFCSHYHSDDLRPALLKPVSLPDLQTDSGIYLPNADIESILPIWWIHPGLH